MLGLHRLGLSGWGLALMVPLLVLGFAHAVIWTTGFADAARPEGFWGSAIAPLRMVLAIAALTLTQSLGEEIGWTGYLLPRGPRTAHPWPLSTSPGRAGSSRWPATR